MIYVNGPETLPQDQYFLYRVNKKLVDKIKFIKKSLKIHEFFTFT